MEEQLQIDPAKTSEGLPLNGAARKEIAVGDVVRLASGGPGMTVTGIGHGDVTCKWFADEAGVTASGRGNTGDAVREATFPAAALVTRPDWQPLPEMRPR